jgi:hypothetical protein
LSQQQQKQQQQLLLLLLLLHRQLFPILHARVKKLLCSQTSTYLKTSHSGDSQDSSRPWTTWAQPNVSLYDGSVYLKTKAVSYQVYTVLNFPSQHFLLAPIA